MCGSFLMKVVKLFFSVFLNLFRFLYLSLCVR